MKIINITLTLLFLIPLFTPVKSTALPSSNLVIYQLQTGGNGSGTASQEFVLLYNQSNQDVNVTDLCIEYSSASNGLTFSRLACIEPSGNYELWLDTKGLVSFSTAEFDLANTGFISDFRFSSGIAGSGGHLRIVDNNGTEIDRLGWGGAVSPETTAVAPHQSGEVLSRDLNTLLVDTDNNVLDFNSQSIIESINTGLYEVEILIDICPNIPELQLELPVGYMRDELGDCYEDQCSNLEGLQIEVPIGYRNVGSGKTCELIPLENATLLITELLPNAPSYDTDQEFIEIYNPNNKDISLKGYKLQLGPNYTKEYIFSEGTIKSGQYIAFYDSKTNITLPNSSASVRIITPAGNLTDETEVYSNPDDDVSWAYIDNVWIYTNQITPNQANLPYLEPAIDEVEGLTSLLAPCPLGKFRNPDTNRCKNIATATSQLVPCSEGQFRNPETNRCKKIDSGSSNLGPCPEGQARNPETNRCRKVAVLGDSTSIAGNVSDVSVEQSEGNINWPVILLIVGSTLGYMIYEWRFEIRNKINQRRLSL